MEAVRKPSQPLSWLQPAILTGSFVPFAVLFYRAATHRLGANPIATALNQLGLLALIFLVASLACTPVKIVLGASWPIRLRKTLGLLGFYTACLHFLTYAALDQRLRLGPIFADVTKRPFIAVGFTALVLLVPVAATSTKQSLAKLGFARWKRIHALVYVVAPLAVIHFVMRVKTDTREPLQWGALVGLLLVVRLFDPKRAKRRKKVT